MKHIQRRSSAALGASLVVMSSLLYGSYGVWTKLMGGYFGMYNQALIRCSLVVVCLLPFALWRKQLKHVHWRRDLKWLALSFMSSGLVSGPLYYATLHIGVGLTSAVLYAGLVLSMFFFGWLFSRERYTRSKFASTLLGFAGLALLFSPSVRQFGVLGVTAALLGGAASGLNQVVSQKMPYSALQSVILAWSGGILANVVMMLLFRESLPPLHWNTHWLFLLVFVVVSMGSSWSVIAGMKRIDAGAAGILGLLEIIWGVLLGVVFFGERPTGVMFAGMAAIVSAAAIPYFQHFRLKDEPFEL
jgi:drug/metabolite transporter (DMT)-like permease